VTAVAPAADPALRLSVWTLRTAVALDCLGIAAAARATELSLVSLLSSPPAAGGLGWSEPLALGVERGAAIALLCLAPLVFVRRLWPVLGAIAIWQLILALAATRMEIAPFAEWSLLARAVRIFAPVSLLLLSAPAAEAQAAKRHERAALWLLRAAAAVTFVAYGWQALRLNSQFVDYLVAAVARCGFIFSLSAAEALLRVIGAVDIVLAILLLTRDWQNVALAMALWGAVTALAPVILSGPSAYPEVLSRATNCGVPLAIALYWSRTYGTGCASAPQS
jgi:hypothetical protein